MIENKLVGFEESSLSMNRYFDFERTNEQQLEIREELEEENENSEIIQDTALVKVVRVSNDGLIEINFQKLLTIFSQI